MAKIIKLPESDEPEDRSVRCSECGSIHFFIVSDVPDCLENDQLILKGIECAECGSYWGDLELEGGWDFVIEDDAD